jgi:hypothetical protein
MEFMLRAKLDAYLFGLLLAVSVSGFSHARLKEIAENNH